VVVSVGIFAPTLVPGIARSHGAVIGAAAWCRAGLCVVGDLTAGRIHAESAVLQWDGTLLLREVRVGSPERASGAPARAAPSAEASVGEMPSLPFVRRVVVEGLVIDGLPLPPLSGEVLPERELYGEGASIVGDQARLALDTRFGVVTLEVEPGAGLGEKQLRASCTCSLEHEALGGRLGDLDVSAEGVLRGREFEGVVVVEGVRVQVEAEGSTLDDVAGRLRLPSSPIAQVYRVFEGVVPEVARAEIRGTIAAEGRFTLEPLSMHVKPQVEGFAVDGLVGPEYRRGRFTWMGHDKTGAYVPVTGGDDSADWLPLPGMGDYLPMAVVAAEDAGFRSHAGFDLDGMLAAVKDNDKAGGIVRGGSTLTQQLAKNLFLTGDRTYGRKLRELLFAVEMERELGKARILELYLNVVEWGPEIHGGKAAAETYFLKSPRGLLPEEAAFLASILRNPRGGWAREYRGGRVNGSRLAWIIDNMVGLDPVLRREALDHEVRFVPPAEE
jgi:hypothetical protein